MLLTLPGCPSHLVMPFAFLFRLVFSISINSSLYFRTAVKYHNEIKRLESAVSVWSMTFRIN